MFDHVRQRFAAGNMMLPAWASGATYTFVNLPIFLRWAVTVDEGFPTKSQTVHPNIFRSAAVVHKAIVPIPGEYMTVTSHERWGVLN